MRDSLVVRTRRAIGSALLLASAGAVLFSGGCASSGAVPKPFPTPGPSASRPPAGEAGDEALEVPSRLVSTALRLRGVPYKNGGADPTGFDCSGFTQYVFARHGIGLPREVREQLAVGATIGGADVRAADLVFFAVEGKSASHVGIAVGDGSFVHAPSARGVVRVERLEADYWARRYVGARRMTP